MKILIDRNILFAEEAFAGLGEVMLFSETRMAREQLRSAEALIVRSTVHVDRELLEGTRVSFVGTASIGYDHIDVEYLQKAGIAFSAAPGCNADAVAEYVFAALLEVLHRQERDLPDLSLGVIGHGNIGSRVARIARALGMTVLCNDPPLQRATGRSDFVDLEAALRCDIVTLHVPLTLHGPDKTHHLIGTKELQKMQPGAVFINTSRGAVVDNQALLRHLQTHRQFTAILDVWENEPGISVDLLKRVAIGTPHIAGYSLEGKVNATRAVYYALCRHLGRPATWRPAVPSLQDNLIHLQTPASLAGILHHAFSHVYRIEADDAQLRRITEFSARRRAAFFESLRRDYVLRRECPNFHVQLDPHQAEYAGTLHALRFRVHASTHLIGEK